MPWKYRPNLLFSVQIISSQVKFINNFFKREDTC